MREIKFRAWDNIINRFRYWDTCDGGGFWDTCMMNELHDIEQFTGLHDKNGKDIYENDIIKNVIYDAASGNKNFFIYQCEWSGNGYTFCSIGENEVIGNIHENPELMEELK